MDIFDIRSPKIVRFFLFQLKFDPELCIKGFSYMFFRKQIQMNRVTDYKYLYHEQINFSSEKADKIYPSKDSIVVLG